MKKLIAIILLCLAMPAVAETWIEKENREIKEIQSRKSRQHQNVFAYSDQSNSDCLGYCGSEHAACIANCSGYGYGYSNQHGQCVARCDSSQIRCMSRCN